MIDPRASCMLSPCSTSELYLQFQQVFLLIHLLILVPAFNSGKLTNLESISSE
jgi:hypothetical protein